MSQLERVIMIAVVVIVVMVMCIEEEQNPCWFRSQTCTLKTTESWYVITGILLTLPTLLLTTSSTDYCLKGNVYDVGLRRLFYSKQYFKNDHCSSA